MLEEKLSYLSILWKAYYKFVIWRGNQRFWRQNLFLMFVVLVSSFKFVIGYDSFLILNKCSCIPNLVFTILILFKNCLSFRTLKTYICPSFWLMVSMLTVRSGLLPEQLLTHPHRLWASEPRLSSQDLRTFTSASLYSPPTMATSCSLSSCGICSLSKALNSTVLTSQFM